jgi:hypothetical protein
VSIEISVGLARIQTWPFVVKAHSTQFVFNRSGRHTIGRDPHTELKMLADVLLRESIENPFTGPKILKLHSIEIGDHVVVADVDVELIARSTPTCVRGQSAVNAFRPRVLTVVAPTHPYIEE